MHQSGVGRIDAVWKPVQKNLISTFTRGDRRMNPTKKLLFVSLAALLGALAVPASAQSGPLTGFVTKLGVELDVRSGGRILQDELAAGNVILPDSATPVGGGSTVPQIQLRGGNVQVNDPRPGQYPDLSRLPPVRACHAERSIRGGVRPQHRRDLQQLGWHSPQSESLRSRPRSSIEFSSRASRCRTTAARRGRAGSFRLPPGPPRPSAIRRSASTATASSILPISARMPPGTAPSR